MRTSVRSVAGAPSTGRCWTNWVTSTALCQTASSKRPSIVGGTLVRSMVTAGPPLGVLVDTCGAIGLVCPPASVSAPTDWA